MATARKASGTRAARTGPKEGQDEGKGVGSVTAPAAQLRVVEPAVPDPEVRERASRRRFTGEYKLGVLREVDACASSGETGALLRREGLYSSHLTTWRRQRELGSLAALAAKKRGRRGVAPSPLARQVAELQREKAHLERRLKQAETIIEVQKKVSEILGIPLKSPAGDERA